MDSKRYDEQITTLEDTIRHQEQELKAKERTKGRVMALLEDDDYDVEEFRVKLSQVKEDIIIIKAAMEDNWAKIQDLRESKANNDSFLSFVRDNQKWLQGLRKDLMSLSPDDKKLLVESLIPGKIKVYRASAKEPGQTGRDWGLGNFPFAFNTAIFQRLAAEGKLRGLTKNDSDHPGAPWPHPLEQGQDFSRHHRHSPRRGGRKRGSPGGGMAEE